ncbi:MAG TPA: hypothetical protein VF618_05905 [Thermoanaerobaculia bacterium]
MLIIVLLAIAAPALAAPRRIIFLIDEMALHSATRSRIMKHALTALREGDEAMIVLPYHAVKIVQPFTTDREALQRGLRKAMELNDASLNTKFVRELRLHTRRMEAVDANPSDYALRERTERVMNEATSARVGDRLAELEKYVRQLGAREGERILVFFTSDLSAASDAVEALAAAAKARGVSLYTIVPDFNPDDSIAPALLSESSIRTARAARALGALFRGDGSLDEAFQQIAGDVRTEVPPPMPLLAAGERGNELGILATAEKPVADGGWRIVDIAIEVPMAKLTFVPDEEERYSATIEVSCALSDGSPVSNRKHSFSIGKEEFDTRDERVFTYALQLRIQPGNYGVEIGVKDSASKLTGFQTMEVAAQ